MAEVAPLLTALRYLWRGTRWRPDHRRRIPAEFAGYLVHPDNTQRTIGDLGTTLGRAAQAASVTDTELLVLTEFYGLNGFPSSLATGTDALVGSVAVPVRRGSP